MRITRLALAAASLVAAACASDGSTIPVVVERAADSRLAAVAASPVADLASAMLTMKVTVTSSLTESVTGGVCAQAVEARTASSVTWRDVTASTYACPALAAILAPGATLTLTAAADQAKVKAVAGTGNTVLLRARSSLAGANTTYNLQSNEVTYQLP